MKGSRPLLPLAPLLCAIAAIMTMTAFAVVAVTVAVPTPPAAAQDDGITITDSGVENRFPDGIHFHIDAASAASTITEIRVYVRKLGQTTRSAYRTMDLEPATGLAVAGEFLFKSRTGNEYIPPGARLSYYFEIRTEDGRTHDTEPETTVYLNRGLDWHSVSRGLINVHYYPLGSDRARAENRAQAVLQVASDTYDLMQPILGVDLTEPMNIVVYSDYDDMRAGLRPSSRVAAQQLRTLGQAFSNERALLVDGSADLHIGDNTLTTAAHEFTHLLVADAAGSAHTAVPTWLNEGLAVYSEQNEDSEFGFYLDRAVRNDAVPPLAALRTFAGTPQETLLNYGMGHAVAAYMLDTYGAPQMSALFQAIRELRNTEKALAATYGLTIHELDNEWRRSVGLAERAETTPAPPPLQVIPTRRPTPTPAAAPSTSAGSAAGATADPASTGIAPTNTAAPTYTPQPPPTRAAASRATRPSTGDPVPPPAAGGCSAPAPPYAGAATPLELATAALLTSPAGLLALAALRRRRPG